MTRTKTFFFLGLTDNSATLIDNIFTNCVDKDLHSSGILLSDMSDYLLCFCILNFEHQFYKRKQFIYRRKIDYSSLFHFYDSL